jgi:hypothetical protein
MGRVSDTFNKNAVLERCFMARNDRCVRVLLGIIAVLLGCNLLVQMNGSTRPQMAMGAGIPDSGAQQQAMVDHLAELGKKMDKLQTYLESGSLSVKVKEMPKAEK